MRALLRSVALLCVSLLPVQAGLAAQARGELWAGAGRATIDIPAGTLPLDGFTETLDDLQVRVVLFDHGDTRVALVVLDQTSLQNPVMARLRQVVSSTANVAPDNVLMCVSHTFSAPHVSLSADLSAESARRHGQLFAALNSAVQTATQRAVAELQPARIGFGVGASHVNVSRDIQTSEGWWLGSNERGYSNKNVAVVRVDKADGKPLAVLLNYDVQPSIMNESVMKSGGRGVTADLAGAATRYVERHYESAVSLFLIGAAGDQAPFLVSHRYGLDPQGKSVRVDAGDRGYALVDLLGERLGAEVVRVSDGIKTGASASPLRLVQDSVELTELESNPDPRARRPSKRYQFVPKGKTSAPFWILQVGDIVVVGVQPELSSSTGADIQARSPFGKTIVMTMVNGGAKYMPEATAFDRFTYASQGSRYEQGAAESFAARILEKLKTLR